MATFALIQNAAIKGFPSINVQVGQVLIHNEVTDTTNSDSGTAAEYTSGRHRYSTDLMGFFNTGGGYPLPIGVASANGPLGRLSRVTLVKRQELTHVTAGDDPQGTASWSKGVARYFGSGFSYVQSTEQPIENAKINLTAFKIPLDSAYSLTANAIVRTGRYQYQFPRGGAVPLPFEFVFTGPVTLVGSNNPFSLTGITLDATLANGKDCDGTVALQQLQATINYEAGTAIPFHLQGPFDGPVAFD